MSNRSAANAFRFWIIAAMACVVAMLVFLGGTSAWADDADASGQEGQSAVEQAGGEAEYIADEERLPGIIPNERPVHSIHDANEDDLRLQADDELPAQYSSVDAGYVTSVKNQGSFGVCWAFSVIAAIESSMLAHGQASTVDLSERHLTYFTFHNAPDALGGTEGDSTSCHAGSDSEAYYASDAYLQIGAFDDMPICSLATWTGVVDENAVGTFEELRNAFSNLPSDKTVEQYAEFLEQTALDPAAAYSLDSMHLSNDREIAIADREDVKWAIIEYGAAATSFYYHSDYFNKDTNAYYYNGMPGSNHAVTLVGWDDEYPIDNFGSEDGGTPSEAGAWLVKNSYGQSWGDGGYFWVSYEDASMSRATNRAKVFDVVPVDTHDNIYQYDGTSGSGYRMVDSGGTIANVYEAHANPGGGELLEAVSFMLYDVNVDYSIQVYRGLSDSTDPTSGTPALKEPVEGATTYEGYYTVELPDPVYLQEGSRYSVVVTLSHGDGSEVWYAADCTDSSYYAFTIVNATEVGQSFERNSEAEPWLDLASEEANGPYAVDYCARLKAFTSNVDAGDYLLPWDDGRELDGRLKANDSVAVSVGEGDAYYAFKPVQDGYYLFYSSDVTGETSGWLYNAANDMLAENSDAPYLGEGCFCFGAWLDAGTTYYVNVIDFNGGDFTLNVELSLVSAVSFQGVQNERFEFFEGRYAYQASEEDDKGTVHTYVKYPEPGFCDGDELTVTEDGNQVVYAFDGSENCFVSKDDGGASIAAEEITWGSDQRWDKPWGIGWHAFTLSYRGVTCEVPVAIVENPVVSISLKPVKPYQVLENDESQGEWKSDDEGERYFCYYPRLQAGDTLTVMGKEGSTTYTYRGGEDGRGFVNDADDGDCLTEYATATDQGTQQLKLGAAFTLTFEYYGRTCQVPVKVVAEQEISASNRTVAIGKTVSVGAKLAKGTGALSYKSSNLGVAKVDAKGVVTPVKVGSAKITISAAAKDGYLASSKSITVKVVKGANTLVVKGKTIKAKASGKATFKASKAIKVTGAQGTLTYKKSNKAGGKKIAVAKNGKITVKKGLKKGKTYKVKVRVTAAGNANYKAVTKATTVTVKVS